MSIPDGGPIPNPPPTGDCGRCGKQLPEDSHSLDYCDATCQAVWQQAQSIPHREPTADWLHEPADIRRSLWDITKGRAS